MSDVPEMVERVARAIAATGPFGHDLTEGEARQYARAAIAAMREADVAALLTQRKFERQYYRDECGCHIWNGPVDRRDGYGRFYDNGKTLGAHQYAFKLAFGDVLPGMVIDHKCRVRRCVNPEHMRAVTNAENVLCGDGITAKNLAKLTCRKGHDLSGENLYVKPNGERDCRHCRLEAGRRYRARKLAALTAPASASERGS